MRPPKHAKAFRAMAALAFCLASGSAYAAGAAGIQGSYLILEDGVLDLRANPQIRESLGRSIGSYANMEDLVVGSLFLTADGSARKVVAISESNGETLIETVVPNVREVIAEFEMPDQSIDFTVGNVIPGSLTEGVSLMSVPTAANALPSGPTWIDTDTDVDIQKARVIGVNIDKVLVSTGNAPESGGDDAAPGSGGGSGSSGGGGGGKAGGNVNVTISGSAELRLKGMMRIADPTLKGGIKMPSMRIRWVKVWWWVGYPEITFENGYIHASFKAAEQIDAKLIGKAEASLEIKIPLYAFEAIDPSGSVSAIVGVYIKTTVEGKLEVVFEVNEYTRFGAWGTVDLFWPFIPIGISTGSDFYYGFALRPSVSAEVEAKVGPYLGFEVNILGLDILSLEAGGGIYANVNGFIEAKDVIGYSKSTQGYGNWSDWYYRVTAELGGYVEANLTIASYDIPLYEQRWPFLTLDKQGDI